GACPTLLLDAACCAPSQVIADVMLLSCLLHVLGTRQFVNVPLARGRRRSAHAPNKNSFLRPIGCASLRLQPRHLPAICVSPIPGACEIFPSRPSDDFSALTSPGYGWVY